MDSAAFATPNSVEGTLEATADRQREGALEGFHAGANYEGLIEDFG